MDAGVPACDLGKAGERICRGAEEEPGHIDTQGCEEDLDRNHFVVNDRCCSVKGQVGFNFWLALLRNDHSKNLNVTDCGWGLSRFLQT